MRIFVVSVYIQVKSSDPRRLDKVVSLKFPRGFDQYSFLNSAMVSDKSVLLRKKVILTLLFCCIIHILNILGQSD